MGTQPQAQVVHLNLGDGNMPLNVKDLRTEIVKMVKHLEQRDKETNVTTGVNTQWENKPDGWPLNIPFQDPNNNGKNGKKLKKEELIKMHMHLQKLMGEDAIVAPVMEKALSGGETQIQNTVHHPTRTETLLFDYYKSITAKIQAVINMDRQIVDACPQLTEVYAVLNRSSDVPYSYPDHRDVALRLATSCREFQGLLDEMLIMGRSSETPSLRKLCQKLLDNVDNDSTTEQDADMVDESVANTCIFQVYALDEGYVHDPRDVIVAQANPQPHVAAALVQTNVICQGELASLQVTPTVAMLNTVVSCGGEMSRSIAHKCTQVNLTADTGSMDTNEPLLHTDTSDDLSPTLLDSNNSEPYWEKWKDDITGRIPHPVITGQDVDLNDAANTTHTPDKTQIFNVAGIEDCWDRTLSESANHRNTQLEATQNPVVCKKRRIDGLDRHASSKRACYSQQATLGVGDHFQK